VSQDTSAPLSSLLPECPSAWTRTRIGDVIELVKKPRGFVPEDDTAFVPMTLISEDGADISVFESRSPEQVTNAYFEDGDLLFARITPCFENGKHGIVRGLPTPYGFATTEALVFRSTPALSVEFLRLLLRYPKLHWQLRARMEGATGRMRVPTEAILEAEVCLPLPTEQQRIVDTVEEYDQRISAASEELDHGRRDLDLLRASILAELKRVDAPMRSVGELGEVFVGATPKRAVPAFWDGDIPWVSSGEVAFCRISKTRETITKAGLGNAATRLHPPGTVLLAMIGEGKTRGQAAILDVAAAHNQNAASIRLDRDKMLPEFLYFCFMRQYATSRALGRGGQQPALNKALVQAIEVPCPAPDTQQELVEHIRAALQAADELETDLRLLVRLASEARTTVVRDALSGRLTVRDVIDEPVVEAAAA
jgi:type I restriction enzyme S subunit